jgi:hypothetical protein
LNRQIDPASQSDKPFKSTANGAIDLQAQAAGAHCLQHQHHPLGKAQPLPLRVAAEGQGDFRDVFIKAHRQPGHPLFTGDLNAAAPLGRLARQIGLPFPELKLMNAVQRCSTWALTIGILQSIGAQETCWRCVNGFISSD